MKSHLSLQTHGLQEVQGDLAKGSHPQRAIFLTIAQEDHRRRPGARHNGKRGEAGELTAAESLTANQYPSLASSRSKLT